MAEAGLDDVAATGDGAVAATAGKRRGRPRASSSQGDEQRSAILRAAARLFREQGYDKVSMTAVAREVGLKQSSLYYWFKSKEQLLDEVLVDGFNSCSFKGAIFRAQDVPAAQRLYALLFRRTAKFCGLPVDVFDAETVADANPQVLRHFFGEFEAYQGKLRALIEEGCASGELRALAVDDALGMALSVVLTQQHLCHRRQAGAAVSCVRSDDASDGVLCWARRAARLAMTMLLADPAQLNSIEAATKAQGWLELS
ncbi:MAG: TetR/AcrR family transcriptional regulator [Coriobacteriales bacterium]